MDVDGLLLDDCPFLSVKCEAILRFEYRLISIGIIHGGVDETIVG